MRFTDNDLMPGESLLASKFANAVITPTEHGLTRLVADGLMWLVGMKDREAIGGRLYLTNQRLLFRSHSINRLTGDIELFLPTIRTLKNTSYLWMRKCVVETASVRQEFVIWRVNAFLKKVRAAREALGPEAVRQIREAVETRSRSGGGGLHVHEKLEALNRAAGGKAKLKAAESKANPIRVATQLALLDLFDTGVAERWNQRFQRSIRDE